VGSCRTGLTAGRLSHAPAYRYALVCGPNRDYLWILSRTPTLDASVRDSLLQTAKGYGFATDKLIWVQQSADQ
jgi:apolipoprotein D and lipocalin family protein